MKRKLLSLFLSLSLVISMPVSFSAKAEEQKKSWDSVKAIENLNKLSDGTVKINVDKDQVFLTGELSKKVTPGKKSALKFLEANKSLFGINSAENDLKELSVEKDELGHTFVKFEQVINGIKVYGSLLNVHFDKNGVIVSVNGSLKENKTIEALGSGKISEAEAVEIAKKQYTFDKLRNTPKVEKVILTQNDKNYEVYKVNISYLSPTIGNYDVFVEVTSGKVIQTENNIRYDGPVAGSGTDVQGKTKNLNLYKSGSSYQMQDVTRKDIDGVYTYDAQNTTTTGVLVSNGSTSFTKENHKASVSAHYYAGKVIDFYKKLFNRNSLDNEGMTINSFTHFDYKYNNAFWDGYEMVYGDGDGELFTYLSGDLDVVGHEMTHGVIDYTAGLYYHNQSGAMNESMADVFGVLISTYDKYNVASGKAWTFNAADWVVGDDIYTPKVSGDALRSLSDPNKYNQPDHMSEYENLPDEEYGDWGGVHINSGIPNKAAYTIASKIGMDKTAKIYYRALTTYMGFLTDFKDAKRCLVQAATDLYGASSKEVTEINNAYNSVGVTAQVVADPYEPNDYFDKAYAIDLGKTYQSYITSESDMDFYKINATSTGNIRVDLWNLPTNYDVAIFDSNGNYIVSSDTLGNASEVINYNVTKTGTYYVVVAGFGNYDLTKKYSLSVKVPVTGVKLDKTSVTLKTGATASLVATVSPQNASNKNVTWKSSDTKVATVDSSGKVKGIAGGTAKITATTSDGNKTATCTVTVSPAVPSSVKAASSGYNSVKTSWGAVSGVSGYQVYTSTSKDGTYKWLMTTTGTSYNNTGLTTGKTYYYKVRAFKTVGENRIYSDYSSVVSAKPIPSIPGSVKAASSGYSSVKTSWNAVSGANGYEIYRATSSNGSYSKVGTATGTSYNNTGLTTGTTYYYKVRAYRTVGSTKVYSNYSSIVNAKPTLSTPGSVKAAKASSTSIKVTWGKVSGASGYEIQRSTSKTGTYSSVGTTTSLSYTNSKLATGKTYYYKVRSYRTVGSKKVYSGWSTIVNTKL